MPKTANWFSSFTACLVGSPVKVRNSLLGCEPWISRFSTAGAVLGLMPPFTEWQLWVESGQSKVAAINPLLPFKLQVAT